MRKFNLISFWLPIALILIFLGLKLNGESLLLINQSNIHPEKVKTLSSSKEWLKLLHYKKKLSGDYESQADEKKFFINSQGKYDPEVELKSTIDFFNQNPEKAICRFPARYEFLKKNFSINVEIQQCKELNQYFKRINADSIAVVFSSYYMNSPASIFGHTFFKIANNDILMTEYAINFSADLSNPGFFKYIIGGLSGYFAGNYYLLPYHEKIREYNDFENRDLWLYYLNFSEKEKDLFLKHIWELFQNSYPYYFLSENCSYHILSAIEAVLPQYNLTDQTKSIVLPVEILRILLEKNNLIKKIEYRPSLRSIFFKQFSKINSTQQDLFYEIIKKYENFYLKKNQLDKDVIDCLIDYFNLNYPTFGLRLDSPENKAVIKLKKDLIIARSEKNNLEEKSDSDKNQPYPPHLIHDSRRFGFYGGKDSPSKFYFFTEFRYLYHDLNDSIQGYPVNGQIEFLKLSVKSYFLNDFKFHSLVLNELALINYLTLNNISFYQKDISWSAYFGAKRFSDNRSDYENGTFAPNIYFTLGLSKIFAKSLYLETHPALLLFAQMKFDFAYSKDFNQEPYSLGAGPQFGFKLTLNEWLNLLLSYERIDYLKYRSNQNIQVTSRIQVIRNFSIDLSYFYNTKHSDYKIGLLFYF